MQTLPCAHYIRAIPSSFSSPARRDEARTPADKARLVEFMDSAVILSADTSLNGSQTFRFES